MNLRNLAYKIIYDVKYNNKYSNIIIDEMYRNYELTHSEKNFTTFLIYGVLSNINYLDYFIKKFSNISFSKISKQARVILEIAIFEIGFMNSSVDYAIVNEAVNLSKKYDNRAKNFINALLRKILSEESNIYFIKNHSFNDIKNKEEFLSTKYSIDKSIAKRFINNYDHNFCIQLLEAMSKTPTLYARGNRLKGNFDSIKNKIEMELDDNLKDYKIIDKDNYIFSFNNFKNIASSNLYKQGFISVQDYSSMKSVLQLEPKEGEKILDICSAPGGKSLFIAELMNDKGSLTSLDISSNKLELLYKQTKRLGINIINIKQNDATILKEEFMDFFDRVLADVPCSGIGIIRKKPEIRYKNFDDIKDLLDTQQKILINSSKYVKINGILVYSTCTLGKEENYDQIKKFIDNNKNFEILYQKELYPNIDNSDGFFICKMLRKY